MKKIGLILTILILQSCASSATKIAEQKAIDAYLELAKNFIQQQDYPAAATQLQRASKIQERDPNLHNTYGIFYAAQKKNKLAEASYKKALKLDPKLPVANNNYGVLLSSLGRYEMAISHFRRAADVTDYPNRALAYENLGDTATLNNDYTLAISAYQTAMRLNNDRWILLLKQSRAHFNLAKFPEAYELFELYIKKLEELKIKPSKTDAELGVAIATSVKDWKRAEFYKELLSVYE